MGQPAYSLSQLIKAISVYRPAQCQADLECDLLDKTKIGLGVVGQEKAFSNKSSGAQRYVLGQVTAALAKARSPRETLLLLNLQLRLQFRYETWMRIARLLLTADLRLYELQASVYQLGTLRFTSLQVFTPFEKEKSAHWMRLLYQRVIAVSRVVSKKAGLEVYEPTAPAPGERARMLFCVTEVSPGAAAILPQILDIALLWHRLFDVDVMVVDTAIPAKRPVSLLFDGTYLPPIPGLSERSCVTHGGQEFPFKHNPHEIVSAKSFAWMSAVLRDFRPNGIVTLGPGNVVLEAMVSGPRCLALPHVNEVPLSAMHNLAVTEPPSPLGMRLLGRAGVPASQLTQFPPAYRLPVHSASVDRESLGVAQDAFVFAIVGMRLENDLTPAFLAMLADIAAQVPSAHFLLVGPLANTDIVTQAAGDLAPRTTILGVRPDVLDILQVCDAYLNPPRQGGGTSAAWALSQGLPVVTLRDGDVAGISGEDFCVDDASDFVFRAAALASNKALYSAQRSAAEQCWARLSDEEGRVRALVSVFDGAPVQDLAACA
ncbi:MAG: glycosyltransferase [Pseudomonadota bacterium]